MTGERHRSVVVTGASGGIGRACALRLHARGWLVLAGVRSHEAHEKATAAGLTPVVLDVTDGETIESAAALITDAAPGGLDGLVNNAGVAVAAPLEFVPLDDVRRQLDVNVTGVLAVTQALLPLLRRVRGRVVTVGSVSGRVTPPFLGPYAASKAAVACLTDALRMELAPWGVHVALVEAGRVDTPIWDRSAEAARRLPERLPPEAMERYGAVVERQGRGARHRGIPADDVGAAVERALTSPRPRSRYLVGRQARLAAIAGHLPPSLRDRVMTRRLPAYSHPGQQEAR